VGCCARVNPLVSARGTILSGAAFVFAHDRVHRVAPGSPVLISSFHPSQQSTFTGKLTPAMLRKVFARAARLVARM
jgi:uracil-DNA glycosylase